MPRRRGRRDPGKEDAWNLHSRMLEVVDTLKNTANAICTCWPELREFAP